MRRMKARLGSPKAITALAHKLGKLIYIMPKYGFEYVEKGVAYYEELYRIRKEANLKKKAKEMGKVGQKLVMEKFDPEKNLQDCLDLWRQVAK